MFTLFRLPLHSEYFKHTVGKLSDTNTIVLPLDLPRTIEALFFFPFYSLVSEVTLLYFLAWLIFNSA